MNDAVLPCEERSASHLHFTLLSVVFHVVSVLVVREFDYFVALLLETVFSMHAVPVAVPVFTVNLSCAP